MLKKLLKHEWTETWRIPAIGLFVFVALSGIGALYLHFFPPLTPDVEIHVGNLLLFIAYAFLSSALTLLVMIYFGIRFYKNMYTDEGYLMHTLPVPAWMHLTAKMLIGVFWNYVLGLVTTCIVLSVTSLAVSKLGYMSPQDLADIRSAFSMLFGDNLLQILFYFIPYMLASCFFSVLLLYAAISLGQLFGKHKVFSSVICYLGLHALVSAVTSVFMVPALTGMVITHAQDSAEDAMTFVFPRLMGTIFFSSFFISLLLSAACFFLCNYLLKKNLNLD